MGLAKVKSAPSYRDRIEAFGTGRFFNRELSWLEFNKRVLEESGNERNPLLERIRFLAISGSNLDEFYRVRVAGIHEQAATGITDTSPDGLTPAEQVKKINAAVANLSARQQSRWTELKNELAKESITLLTATGLSHADRDWLQTYFMRQIFSALRLRCRRCGASVPAYPEPGACGRARMRAPGRRRAALHVRLRRGSERARPLHQAAPARPEHNGSPRFASPPSKRSYRCLRIRFCPVSRSGTPGSSGSCVTARSSSRKRAKTCKRCCAARSSSGSSAR